MGHKKGRAGAIKLLRLLQHDRFTRMRDGIEKLLEMLMDNI
jgi:hypothetical protein